MKKVLILSGSPRIGGNSDILCDEFKKGAIEAGNEVEKTEVTDYSYEDIMNLKFKLLLNTDYFEKENGVWVDKTYDGNEVVALFEESKPFEYDAILMDMGMPECNGMEATFRIRHLVNIYPIFLITELQNSIRILLPISIRKTVVAPFICTFSVLIPCRQVSWHYALIKTEPTKPISCP